MKRRLKEPFGKAGLTVAVIALVFAMLGGAYAASNSDGGKATASAKAKKGPKGPKGAKGDTGPAGPQGPAGAPGAKGDAGAAGANGKDGTNGTNGTNGTFSTEPLPSGETLTGVWSASGGDSDGSVASASLASISFPIRVSPVPVVLYPTNFLGFAVAKILKDGSSSELFGPKPTPESLEDVEEDSKAYEEACPGTVEDPKATKGLLCIYPGQNSTSDSPPYGPIETPEQGLVEAANEFGLVMPFRMNSVNSTIRGSWAVTAG